MARVAVQFEIDIIFDDKSDLVILLFLFISPNGYSFSNEKSQSVDKRTLLQFILFKNCQLRKSYT